MIVVTKGGSLGLLAGQLDYLSTLKVRLFVNDLDPDIDDDVGDYEEASFPGYDEILLEEWSTPALNIAGKAETVEQVRVWTTTASGSDDEVYGYYVVDAGGDLVWAERAAGDPVAMDVAGKHYSVQPRLTDRNDPG